MIPSHRSKPLDQPLHIHAHSTIDNWQTDVQTLRRTKSLPSVPEQVYIEPQSRIDTWQKQPIRSLSTISFVCSPSKFELFNVLLFDHLGDKQTSLCC